MSLPPDPNLSCRELVELVTDYLEDALPRAERERFELHLVVCDGCRAYLEQMRQVLRAAGRLEERSLGPEARAKLLAAFRGWKQGGRGP